MNDSLQQILPWVSHYGYFVLFALAILEGPIITIIAGALCALGQLNLVVGYAVIVAGDTVGDCLYYILGRYGRRVPPRILAWFGITAARIDLVKKYFVRHPKKTFALGKLSHGIGAVPLFAAGLIQYPFGSFILLNILFTAIKSSLLLAIGFYFGEAAGHWKTYLDYGAIAGLILGAGLYLGFLKYTKSDLKT